jgi:hypothetical protein
MNPIILTLDDRKLLIWITSYLHWDPSKTATWVGNPHSLMAEIDEFIDTHHVDPPLRAKLLDIRKRVYLAWDHWYTSIPATYRDRDLDAR